MKSFAYAVAMASLVFVGCSESRRTTGGGGGGGGNIPPMDAQTADGSEAPGDGGSQDALPGADAVVGQDFGFVDGSPIDAGQIDVGFVDSGFDSGVGADAMSNPDASSPMDAVVADLGVGRDATPAADAGAPNLTCDPNLGPGACGGNPTGNWVYTDVCIDSNVFNTLLMACPVATISNLMVTATGTLFLTNTGNYTRNLSGNVMGDVFVPALCTSQFQDCGGVQAAIIASTPNSSALCIPDSIGACDCSVTISETYNDSGNYSIPTPGIVRLENGPRGPQEFHYCAQGNVLKYKGAMSLPPSEEAVSYVLTK